MSDDRNALRFGISRERVVELVELTGSDPDERPLVAGLVKKVHEPRGIFSVVVMRNMNTYLAVTDRRFIHAQAPAWKGKPDLLNMIEYRRLYSVEMVPKKWKLLHRDHTETLSWLHFRLNGGGMVSLDSRNDAFFRAVAEALAGCRVTTHVHD